MCFSRVINPRCSVNSDSSSVIVNCSQNADHNNNEWLDKKPGWNHTIGRNNYTSNIMFPLTNMSFINEKWIITNSSEIVIKVSAFLPIVLWGIFGNILLLHIIVRNRHLLRSPTNLLIGNMAAADLASLLIHPWVFLIYDFFQNYQLGEFGCKAEGALECAVLLASVMNLLAISYDRLTAIALPRETRLTRNGARIVMIVAWLVGFALASPLYIYRSYKERQWKDFLEKFCTENVLVINIYWHIIITMMVWLPLLIMLICYITIFVKLDRYEQNILRRVKKTKQVHYKKRVAKMMFIVVVTFMVCRLPFTALIFYRNYLMKSATIKDSQTVQNQVTGLYHTLWFISKYLIFVNAALNPMIYGLTNEKFKKALKATALAKWIIVNDSSNSTISQRRSQFRSNNNNDKENNSGTGNIFMIFKGRFNYGKRLKDAVDLAPPPISTTSNPSSTNT